MSSSRPNNQNKSRRIFSNLCMVYSAAGFAAYSAISSLLFGLSRMTSYCFDGAPSAGSFILNCNSYVYNANNLGKSLIDTCSVVATAMDNCVVFQNKKRGILHHNEMGQTVNFGSGVFGGAHCSLETVYAYTNDSCVVKYIEDNVTYQYGTVADAITTAILSGGLLAASALTFFYCHQKQNNSAKTNEAPQVLVNDELPLLQLSSR